MGKLYAIGNTTLRVYSRDHRPAHVHVIAPDCEALIRLDTMMVMRGALPMPHRREIIQWIEANRTLIVDEWNRCNPDIATA